MASTIGTCSIENPSIFSGSCESYVSASTEWTFQAPIKLGDGYNDVQVIGQVNPIVQIGRPANKWTSSSLRKLIRLYLLTDLDLVGIIDCLRTNDFQPCKRNVQEKLSLLLQPQPNKIRRKGDTKILRRLLLECRHLQKTRKLRQQQRHRQHRLRTVENGVSDQEVVANIEQAPLKTVNGSTCSDSSYTSSAHLFPLESLNHEEGLLAGVPSTVENVEAAVFSLSKDKNEGFHPLRTIIHDTQTQMFSLPDSMSSVPSLEWVLGDYISQPEHPYTRPTKQDNRNSIYNSLTVSDIYENLEPNSILCPDLGFDSDFGPKSVHSFPEPVFNPSTFSPANVSQTKHPTMLIHPHPLVPSKFPMVNPTYLRDNRHPYWGADK